MTTKPRNLDASFDNQLTIAAHITKIVLLSIARTTLDASGNTFQWMQLQLLSTPLLVTE